MTEKAETMPSEFPKILLWGDSLTQIGWDGWVGKLAHVYQRRADVINRGMSGYNTKWYRLYLQQQPQILQNVQLVIIFFGANDASLPNLNPHHYVSLRDYQDNLKHLIQLANTQYASNNTPPRILLVTPPPVVHQQRFEYQKQRYKEKATGVLERTLENSQLYADACQQVADQHQLPCVHLWKQLQTHTDWHSFFYDGLHFSKQGQEAVFDAIYTQMAQSFPELAVQADPITQQWNNSATHCPAIASNGPYHDEIDHDQPEASFQRHYGKRPKVDSDAQNKL